MGEIEHETRQIGGEDFRPVGRLERGSLRLVPQPIADARLDAPGAAAPLVGGGARHPHGLEPGQAHVGLVARHPGEPAVDDDAHAFDSQRGFRDRGGEHDLAPAGRRRGDRTILQVGFQRAVERHDVDRGIGGALAQQRLGAADLGGARKKDQQRAGVGPQRPHHRLRDLPLDRDARVAPDIARLDRVGAAGALDHRRLTEQPADARAVEGRRHDQELEVLAQPLLHVAGERKAEIGVERALVELVEEDGSDAVERRILEHQAGEDAFGHDLDAGRPGNLGAETDAVAHGRADRLPERRRHARRGGPGGEPARLEHQDFLVPCPFLRGEDERHPRRLAGAGRGDQNRRDACSQGGGQLRQRGVDG